MMKITKYNYLIPLQLFLHYLFGNGETVNVEIEDNCTERKWYAGYLALGHYDASRGFDLYDFNLGEWPTWLINAGTPFLIRWN